MLGLRMQEPLQACSMHAAKRALNIACISLLRSSVAEIFRKGRTQPRGWKWYHHSDRLVQFFQIVILEENIFESIWKSKNKSKCIQNKSTMIFFRDTIDSRKYPSKHHQWWFITENKCNGALPQAKIPNPFTEARSLHNYSVRRYSVLSTTCIGHLWYRVR